MPLKRAVLIDVDYTIKDGKTLVRLLMKGKRFFRLYDFYDPYFYIDAPISKKDEIMKASVDERGQKVSPTSVEEVTRTLFGKEKKLLKVTCLIPSAVPKLRDKLPHFPAYEYRILFGRRYMIDKNIAPFSTLIYEREGKFLKKIHRTADLPFSLRTAAFDIETYNPRGAPRPKLDPTIMISYANGKQQVITTKKIDKPFIEHAKDEKEMITQFCKLLSEQDIEVLLGYNSAVFDLPYLAARADILKVPLSLGRDGSSFRIRKMGIRETAEITGRLHIDLYSIIRFLGFIGALKVSKFTLENAYSEITGKKKYMVDRLAIHEMWDKGGEKLDTLADYSMMDAKATLELGSVVMPLEIEMSKLVRLPLFDTANATAGQLVESLLMHRSYHAGAIIPNKPGSEEAAEREKNPIQGAFVKLPQPGIYDNLAVFDFRGLYPSIITSHNIDPYTLNCDCCKQDSYVSPLGHRFCKKKKGLIPAVLADIISQRAKLKGELKALEKDSSEYTRLFARQQSLKILANSYYGYLAYARSRWYSREAGESVTAWGRHYIQETIKKAETAGFEILYGDTDSIFILLGQHSKDDALSFMKKINDALPGDMELELEAFYPRGVFVTKKGLGGKGAKKKYALIGEDGKIKIRGFELVRRDWSRIAKDTQMRVLEAILKEGSKEKAVKIVRDEIERLREGKVPLEDLTIYTQLNKSPGSYEIKSPELSAAQKAAKAGIKFDRGSLIGYVITKSGSTISDKAVVLELAQDYDPNYYIDHQVLPSVLKILKELGFSEDDLKFKGTQKGLGGFFE
jgi:DNA polymerase I